MAVSRGVLAGPDLMLRYRCIVALEAFYYANQPLMFSAFNSGLLNYGAFTLLSLILRRLYASLIYARPNDGALAWHVKRLN